MKTALAAAAALGLAVLAGCSSTDAGRSDSKPVATADARVTSSAAVVESPSAQPDLSLATLDPNAPYRAVRSNPVTYDVDFAAVVQPPSHSKVLRVWMPVPQSDSGQEVTEGEFSTFPMQVEPKIGTEKKYGNKFAYFEFKDANGAQVIRHKFKVKIYQLNWNLDPAKIQTVTNWPASFGPYLKGESQAVVVDDRFDKFLNEVVPQRGNPLTDMSAVMDRVIKEFKYDHNMASLHASSLSAFDNQGGHCSDYHGFCSAVGRMLNSPTRVTYGMNPFPKNSPSHCKMEAYLPPYGWVSFDVSETQNLIGAINKAADLDDAAKQRLPTAAKQRLVGGFRDNTWFVQTRGTDYDLEPPAAKRAAVVRTVYVEADGVEIPDTDTAATHTKAYTWLTVQNFVPDRPVTYPFKDYKTLANR